MLCPWEHCAARLDPLQQQASPDSPLTVEVFPPHKVVGPNYWFGMCPGGHLIVPALTEPGRNVLAEASHHYEAMLRDRRAKLREQRTSAAEDAPAAPRLPPSTWFTEGGGAKPGTPNGATARDHLELVPELRAVPNGDSNVSDSLRDQLRALASLTIESLQQVHNQTAAAAREVDNLVTAALSAIENLDASLRELQEKIEAAQQIAVAAVGSDNPPQSASDMVTATSMMLEPTQTAEAMLTGFSSAVYATGAGVNLQLADTLRAANAGAEAARDYLASI